MNFIKSSTINALLQGVYDGELTIKDLKRQGSFGIGFWRPQYSNGINVPGYHLHFISEDRKFGGHILTASLPSGKVQMSRIYAFRMELPQGRNHCSKQRL